MKILYLCADHGIPVYGRRGCSTHVREACRGLVAAGHDVTLVASNTGGDSPVVEGLRVVCVEPPRSRRMGYDLRNYWHNIAFYSAARNIADRDGIDAIYERLSLYGMTGMWLARRYRLPLLLEINAFLSREHARKLHFRRFARRMECRIACRASGCIVVSDPLRQDLLAMGVEDRRITIMPTAVDTSLFRPDAARRAETRRRLGIPGGRLVVGYVGGLADWHGVATLHDTARALAAAGLDAVVLVVGGDGDEAKGARAAAREAGADGHMLFTGGVPYTEVPAMLDAMDVAVVPDTLPWTCPTKMFEYQASELPTVAPRYPGVAQAMDDGREGLLFEPHDWAAMTQAVLRLAGDVVLRHMLGEAARPRVEATHSWRCNAKTVTGMFERLKAKG
jgi:glycosyltransferase involved in cell wall biosynthesis